MCGLAEIISTTLNGYDSVIFSHRVPVGIEQPTVYHLQSTVAFDWACWLCPSQESSLLVALHRVSSFNTKMRELLVHQSASPQSVERGLHDGILWWEHQKLKGNNPPLLVPSQARPEEALLKYLYGAIWGRMSHIPIVGTSWQLSIPAVSITGGPAEKFSTTLNGHYSVRFFLQSANSIQFNSIFIWKCNK